MAKAVDTTGETLNERKGSKKGESFHSTSTSTSSSSTTCGEVGSSASFSASIPSNEHFNTVFGARFNVRHQLTDQNIDVLANDVRGFLKWLVRSWVWLYRAFKKYGRYCKRVTGVIKKQASSRNASIDNMVKHWTIEEVHSHLLPSETSLSSIPIIFQEHSRQELDSKTPKEDSGPENHPELNITDEHKQMVVKVLYFRERSASYKREQEHQTKIRGLMQRYNRLRDMLTTQKILAENSESTDSKQNPPEETIRGETERLVESIQGLKAKPPVFDFSPESITHELLIDTWRELVGNRRDSRRSTGSFGAPASPFRPRPPQSLGSSSSIGRRVIASASGMPSEGSSSSSFVSLSPRRRVFSQETVPMVASEDSIAESGFRPSPTQAAARGRIMVSGSPQQGGSPGRASSPSPPLSPSRPSGQPAASPSRIRTSGTNGSDVKAGSPSTTVRPNLPPIEPLTSTSSDTGSEPQPSPSAGSVSRAARDKTSPPPSAPADASPFSHRPSPPRLAERGSSSTISLDLGNLSPSRRMQTLSNAVPLDVQRILPTLDGATRPQRDSKGVASSSSPRARLDPLPTMPLHQLDPPPSDQPTPSPPSTTRNPIVPLASASPPRRLGRVGGAPASPRLSSLQLSPRIPLGNRGGVTSGQGSFTSNTS